MKKPLWIFFDMGSTLVDESGAYRKRNLEMLEGTGITLEQFLAKCKELNCHNSDVPAIEYFGLTKPRWPREAEILFPDAFPTLEALKTKGYHLGIIANQSPGAEQRLKNWGILPFFEVVAPSAELGMEKPEPDIFFWALEKAGCRPEDAVMIGDRLDNDVAPANRLGMLSIRILRGSARAYSPASEEETPDFTVEHLTEIPSLFE